jgi:hypothetical protein
MARYRQSINHRPSRRSARTVAANFAGLAACCLALCGCGDDRGLVPVSGTVTLGGQAMPGPGDLTFVPLETPEGFPVRPAKAEFAADGFFRAQSYQPGDGLYPGKYRVLVSCWEVAPTPDGPPAKSFIPRRYQSHAESGLELQVEPGSAAIDFPIDLQPAG